MKIVHAASEMFPLVKTGGLADVSGALSKALAGFGHDVVFFLPGYRKILELPEFARAKLAVVLQIELAGDFLRSEIYALPLGKRRTLYIVRRDEFFDRAYPYGGSKRDYDDNDRRFIYFSKAIVEAMRILDIKADILHCHDWQTALAPLLLRIQERETNASLALSTFFSIHNLAFQGVFPNRSFRFTNLPVEFNDVDGLEFYEQVSLIKGGIFFADKVMTVSGNYAREIVTPEFGCGLDGALRMRQADLVGIVNGIDTGDWNPVTDPHLPSNYSRKDLTGKSRCREALLEELGLSETTRPVYGIVTRLTEQKGVDLLLEQIPWFVKHDCALIVLGKGDPAFEQALRRRAKAHPKHISVSTVLDEAMSHRVEAGCDFYLTPSHFEPCGLNPMYSQRYGSVPIVSKVGGLLDTVTDIASHPAQGTGILFEPNSKGFQIALERSLELFADFKSYRHAQLNGMARDFSWIKAAREYEALYLDSI